MQKKIRVLIIDDEDSGRELLYETLTNLQAQGITVVGSCADAEEGYSKILSMTPDVVFLDIEMPGLNGFEMLKKFETINFQVVFVTAYNQYALQAIKFNAIDYILKPINIEEVAAVVQKIVRKNPVPIDNSLTNHFVQNLNQPNPYLRRLPIPTRDGFFFANINEILRCESDINYTMFYFVNGKKIMASKTLKEFSEILEEYDFMRVHKSHLINLHFVKSFSRSEGGIITMMDNSEVLISDAKKKEFLTRLGMRSKE